jgi:hypothetical protein
MTDNLARVLPFVQPDRPTERRTGGRDRTVVPIRNRPARRVPRNGHSADCPYWDRPRAHCSPCRSEDLA